MACGTTVVVVLNQQRNSQFISVGRGADLDIDASESVVFCAFGAQLAFVVWTARQGHRCAGHVLVVDGAAWMWREPALPRSAVTKASRGVESKSRTVGTARSKL